MIKIIKKVDIEKEYLRALKSEQDYELASLSYALKQKDENEIERSKKRLIEIHFELEGLTTHI